MEEKIKIFGGKKLFGNVQVQASKNAFLPILAASVLCDGEILLKNFCQLSDLKNMLEILETLDIQTKLTGKELYINTKDIKNNKIMHQQSQKLRASIILLGALLARFRKACICYPGGCKIGARPIDIHLHGFKCLGAKITERHGFIFCDGSALHSGDVMLPFPSVGATESLMMCACLIKGITRIKNAAKEPEIVDLANFLNSMGAKVYGAGTDYIEIEGVISLHGTTYSVMSDRIVAGTYLLAAATCGGDVLVENAYFKHNESLISFLRQTACQIDVFDDKIRLKCDKRLKAIEQIQTLPYPAFPTDLQPQMMALQSVSDGVCVLQENVFENRFSHVMELCKMGANIVTKDRAACIVGVEKLYGADVYASDLRAGAALVIAGLKAEGYTTVHNVGYIDRGYEDIETNFSLLGADIKRVAENT